MSPELISEAVNEVYRSLPSNGKPTTRDNGKPEWTVLAAVVLVKEPRAAETEDRITVVSLATGVRCLPRSKLSPHGDTLHDSHAEVLTRRGFIVWLIEEIKRLRRAEHELTSRDDTWLKTGEGGRFRFRSGVKVCFYVSNTPCGDASIALLNRQHALDDTAPDEIQRFTPSYLSSISASLRSPATSASQPPNLQAPSASPSAPLVARGHLGFSLPPVLRTKPGRLDSPPSLSHSCSDKLATWNVVGLQGALMARVVEPVFVAEWVVSVPAQGTPTGMQAKEVRGEVERAIVQRVERHLPDDRRATVSVVSTTFPDSHESIFARNPPDTDLVTSGLCISYVAGLPVEVIGPYGTKSGAAMKKLLPNGALPSKSRSRLCKLELLSRLRQISDNVDPARSYYDLKHPSATDDDGTARYQTLKGDLRGADGALEGWLVHGREVESFDADGTLVRNG